MKDVIRAGRAPLPGPSDGPHHVLSLEGECGAARFESGSKLLQLCDIFSLKIGIESIQVVREGGGVATLHLDGSGDSDHSIHRGHHFEALSG